MRVTIDPTMTRLVWDAILRHSDLAQLTHVAVPPNELTVALRERCVLTGAITACIWRYHENCRDAFLTKDNTAYREKRRVTAEELMGVVATVLPRERRNELENYARIQELIAIERDAGRHRSRNLGFYTKATCEAFSAVVTIPHSERIGKRLP
jgi:hypothetical protein